MGDDRSMNAIPTGVWVRRELVDALRGALPDSYRPGMYVALHDAARSVVDAVETEDEPKMPMTDLPDAVVNAAVEAFARKRNPKHNTLDHSETLAIRAALAAASGPWAEQLDAAGWRTEAYDARKQIAGLAAERDAALARNAESYEDGYNQGHADAHADGAAPDRLCALRAELDSLRDRVTALADKTPWKTTDHLGNVTGYLINADQLAAIVRGSDDEEKP